MEKKTHSELKRPQKGSTPPNVLWGKKVMTLIQIHPLLAADLPRLVRKFKKEVACVVLVRLTYKGIQKYLEIWN